MTTLSDRKVVTPAMLPHFTCIWRFGRPWRCQYGDSWTPPQRLRTDLWGMFVHTPFPWTLNCDNVCVSACKVSLLFCR